MKPLEQLGRTAGWLVAAPTFAALSALRRSRPLHPHGSLLEGSCVPAPAPDDLAPIAEATAGAVLGRFSGALWKNPTTHLPDVLGCALRIGGEQDLLFATIQRPWTTALAPLTTDVDDYLANYYFAVSPFTLADVPRRFYLRLRPIRTELGSGVDRDDRLHATLRLAGVGLAIEASYRARIGYQEIARVTFDRIATPDAEGEAIRFDPFKTGRGIRPSGAIHALRRGAYAASQATRTLLVLR